MIQIFSGSDPATRRLLASAVADANGAWIATVLEPLADGVYSSLVVEATSSTGASMRLDPWAVSRSTRWPPP